MTTDHDQDPRQPRRHGAPAGLPDDGARGPASAASHDPDAERPDAERPDCEGTSDDEAPRGRSGDDDNGSDGGSAPGDAAEDSDDEVGGDDEDDEDDEDDDDEDDEEHVEPRSGAPASEHLAEIEHLRLELDAERVRVAELRDALVRTAADFDNHRKRVERDRVEERRQATAGVVRNMLPVLDAVGRALQSASSSRDNPELEGFVEGIRMVEAQLMDVLRQAGLEPVPTEGVFDPAYHEALLQEPSESADHMAILDVFEPGYRLGGRLLRPARVKVAHNPGAVSGRAGAGPQGDDTGDA